MKPWLQRFVDKVRVDSSGCWLFQTVDGHGYGQFYRDGGPKKAHRIAFELWNGCITDLEIDHLCRTPACINPDHLELVTHRENMDRGISGKRKRQTHCRVGHPFDEKNTRHLKDGRRACRACHRQRQKK